MKWKFSLLVALLLMAVALPLAAAAPVTTPLELSTGVDENGDGWDWDGETNTLTLSGIELKVATAENNQYALVLPGDTTIILKAGTKNSIENSVGGGIYSHGDLMITGEDSGEMSILVKREGLWADGNVEIADCGSISIHSEGTENYYGGGINVGAWSWYEGFASIRISNCKQFSIKTGCGQGLWAKTSIDIRECGTVSIDSSGDGIDAGSTIFIQDCDQVAVSSAEDGGICSSDDLIIDNCGEVSVSSEETSIYCGGDLSIYNCILTAVSSEETCIYAGDISIWGSSRLSASGTDFAIYGEDNISIIESHVQARCGAEGFAAIFAAAEDSTIELDGCAVLAPEGGKVVDVAIPPEGGYVGIACQSICAGPGITIINDWTQAAKEVLIGPEGFSVTFDSQGGSSIPAVNTPGGSTITAPPAPTREGYTFGGWYRDAACTEAWDFSSSKVEGNITLYAKWNLAPEAEESVEEPTKKLPPAAGNDAATAIALLLLSGGLLLLCRSPGEYARD